jgi:hypothetical protein
MTLKAYLIIMSSATSICLVALAFVLWSVDPTGTNWIGFCLFYSSLFLSLAGIFSLVGFLIRFIALKQELAFRLVRDAFRQSFLFSFLIVAILYLLSKNLFSWMNVIFLVIGITVFEFFLLGYNRS